MGLVAMIADIIGLEFVQDTNISIKMFFSKKNATKKVVIKAVPVTKSI